MVLVCFIIGMVFVETVVPFFRNYTGRPVVLQYVGDNFTIPFLISLIILTGILSGCYPAIYLSSFNPVEIFRDRLQTGKGGLGFEISWSSSSVAFLFS